MAKAKVTIGKFKISYERKKENVPKSDEPTNLETTIHTFESHHDIICEIEGDFIQEFSDAVERFFAAKFNVPRRGPEPLKASDTDYDGIKIAIDIAKKFKGRSIVVFGKLPEPLKKKIIADGYTVQEIGGQTKISWKE